MRAAFRVYRSKRVLLTRAMSTPHPLFHLHWKDITKESIARQADELVRTSTSRFDSVGRLQPSEVTFDNTIKVLADNKASYETRRALVDFPHHVHPNKDIRNASTEADKKLSEFDVEMSMRQDVFNAVAAIKEKGVGGSSPETERLVDRILVLGKRNGLHLSEEKQQKVKEIKKRMSDLSISFSKNLAEENTTLEFAESELVGLPEDFIQGLEKAADGKRCVSLKYPHYYPAMKRARIPKTRQRLEKAFLSRCKDANTKILEELVVLRSELSDVLGYKNHASYITELRMAKTADAVQKFLAELGERIKPLRDRELDVFLKYKSSECDEFGFENDGRINGWDVRYYMNMVEEKEYSVDQQKLKEYFPLDAVTKGLLGIYQDLLGLKFSEVSNPDVWHEDVRLFSCTDAECKDLLGWFYLDLHPREGKYGHAAVFGLQPGCLLSDGKRQPAIAAMVANFTKPTAEKPSLLLHDEVVTYFHEFGHVMHQICAQADYAMFSGTRVERDFVEAPSQMLENWCWEKESLARMSKHYKDGSSIPEEMMEKLVASRNANTGVHNARQITFGLFDQIIHTGGKCDVVDTFSKVQRDVFHVPASSGTSFPATFEHLAGGYDAQYYGYLWSEVFSADMFHSRFKKEGLLNPKVGNDYRTLILKPGGSRDGADMLRDFLGRESSQDAFLKSKGLL
ncbi:thimet oligopeptidase-like [Oscarella lobularis]|uniref:thimet oligopeptidase-like n=1 Tax=Oscarella lobularis TaxID=121494 RepID=UPI0033144BE8